MYTLAGINKGRPSPGEHSANFFCLISARRNLKCHIRCNIIFTEITFHPESSRLLTFYILGFAAYFLYMIFFTIPVSNDDSDKSCKKELNLILKLFKSYYSENHFI